MHLVFAPRDHVVALFKKLRNENRKILTGMSAYWCFTVRRVINVNVVLRVDELVAGDWFDSSLFLSRNVSTGVERILSVTCSIV